MKIVNSILALFSVIAGFFSALFYVLMKQAKDEQKAEEKENEELKENIEAIQAAEEAVREERKANEELVEKANSGNNLDAFDAINQLLSK